MKDSTIKKAAYYARVSTLGQKERDTIAAQIDELETRISSSGEILDEKHKYIDNGVSGTLDTTPTLKRLVDDAFEGSYDKLYVTHPDRLARSLDRQLSLSAGLKKAGVEIVFTKFEVEKNIEGTLFLNMLGVIAQYERDSIIRRLMTGRIKKIKNGKVFGNIPPFGYNLIKKADGVENRYVINEAEAAVVKLIFQLWDDGLNLSSIARELDARGIRGRRERPMWRPETIRILLKNETYAGTTYYNKYKSIESKSNPVKGKNTSRSLNPKDQWYPIKVPAIISRKVFNHVQDTYNARTRRFSPNKVHSEFFLRGLLRCGQCQCPLYTYGGSNSTPRRYYICAARTESSRKNLKVRKYASTVDKNCTNYRSAEIIEKIVWDAILELAAHPKQLTLLINRKVKDSRAGSQRHVRKLSDINQATQTLATQRKKLVEIYTSGLIGKDDFANTIGQYNLQREQLQADKEVLEKKFSNPLALIDDETIKKDGETFSLYLKELESISALSRAKCVRSFIKQVIVSNDSVIIEFQRLGNSTPRLLPNEVLASKHTVWQYTFDIRVGYRTTKDSQLDKGSGRRLGWLITNGDLKSLVNNSYYQTENQKVET